MNKLQKFLNMVDFGHSLFGLPFAYLGAFLALKGVPTLAQFGWITLAMVSARTAALCLNRLIDRHIDRQNPRTADWVMASGQLSVKRIWVLVFVFIALLFLAAYNLNPLCVKLAPLAVIVLWLYSYTKRFTWWCHLILGLAIGIGPLGGWIAISGTFDWQPFVLAMAVAFWIAGFDTMYACQDIDFDRAMNLYSIPARFGERGALLFSAVFHLFTVLFLILNGFILDMGIWYYTGVAFTAILLTYEHIIVRPGNLDRVNFASFRINHYVGLIILITAVIDLLS
ncbi:4-hydroxybenzoate polyprenyltransferase-related [Syntrophomonas zehnderi OL-4]|uniref:4-hydroxybenzoate polyprenyltransferase n=1 Tax=Syntrophomonas zehnderi OL-4 TaxID=690567 RepID=A0A0E3W3M3_9FIRM|nr:UbiA-like polyprenyltransferase [Syntrophomonas zehnderi]CFX92943.1 4-hydroxybenzoate polyprenyltransferase-related [Syntrophomonas zehnderi OL-4]